MLERIAAHLAVQEKKGERVSLLVEPFLAKKLDFSCQMHIELDGQVRFLSLQQMHNQQLAYQGSSRLGAEQTALIERSGYFRQMEAVGARIYREGYWGDVCIDSMQLEDGCVIPVVEINARKSMGLMNYHLDQFFSPDGLHSYFTFLSVGYPGPLRFDELLQGLEQAGLLFTRRQMRGILPLSANTLTINLNQPRLIPAPFLDAQGALLFFDPGLCRGAPGVAGESARFFQGIRFFTILKFSSGKHRRNEMILDSGQIEPNISWLLKHGSPPVRYLTHEHLMKTPDRSQGVTGLWGKWLAALAKVGMQDDVRVKRAYAALVGAQREDGGWVKPSQYARREDDWLTYYATRIAANLNSIPAQGA